MKSKIYSYLKEDDSCGKTAKGIKKVVIKKDITHADYKETLFNKKQMHHKMKAIRSDHHLLGSYEINKISLSFFDGKRYIHDHGVTRYAFGHYITTNKQIKRHATAVKQDENASL